MKEEILYEERLPIEGGTPREKKRGSMEPSMGRRKDIDLGILKEGGEEKRKSHLFSVSALSKERK